MTLYITEMLTFKPITQIQWIILVQASEFEMTFPCLRKIDIVPFKSQFVSLDGHRQSVNAIWTGIYGGKKKNKSHRVQKEANNTVRAVWAKP